MKELQIDSVKVSSLVAAIMEAVSDKAVGLKPGPLDILVALSTCRSTFIASLTMEKHGSIDDALALMDWEASCSKKALQEIWSRLEKPTN